MGFLQISYINLMRDGHAACCENRAGEGIAPGLARGGRRKDRQGVPPSNPNRPSSCVDGKSNCPF